MKNMPPSIFLLSTTFSILGKQEGRRKKEKKKKEEEEKERGCKPRKRGESFIHHFSPNYWEMSERKKEKKGVIP